MAQALLYFVGGSLTELALAARLPEEGQWEDFMRDAQTMLAEAMVFCRQHLEGQKGGARWRP